MQEYAINGAISTELSALFAMLWVFGLMGCVMLTFVANRREETIRMRIGIEIETLRDNHAQSAPNESIAVWLEKMKAEHGEKYVQSYLKSTIKSRSEWRKTKKSRLQAIQRTLPLSYKEANFTVFTEGWSQGRTSDRTKVITDGSLSSGGFEVVSHPLYDGTHHPWLAIIGKLLRPITRTDRTCGLHVHVGLRDPNTRFGELGQSGRQMAREEAIATTGKTVWGYTYFNKAFNQLVSPSRHSHQYCQKSGILNQLPNAISHESEGPRHHYELNQFDPANLSTDERWQYVDVNHVDMGVYVNTVRVIEGRNLHHRMYEVANEAGRYYHVNTQALLNRGPYGTIEFRQHQGTINPTKIGKWVDLLHKFVMRCHDDVNFAGIESYPQTLEGLWAFMDLPADHHLVDYYTKRAVILSGSTLIRACKDCGSNTCVHYECNVVDTVVEEESIEFFNNRHSYTQWECDECGSEIPSNEVNEYDFPEAYCNMCETEVGVSHGMGLIAVVALGFMVSAPIIGAVALIVGCGIGAIHAGVHKFTGGLRFKGATKRFKTMFGALAVRGGQASGFAWDNGEGVYYLKAPKSSVYLKNRATEYLTKDTKWSIGHTRFATHGKNNADNAHPHFSEHVTLVHNGVVHNHDDVYKALGVKPYGPVDSQAIVACLEVGGIEEVVKHCEGTMSLIWNDNRDPQGTLKFWSNGGNPLCSGRLDNANTGMVVVCSTMDILEKSMGKRLKTSWSCTVGREYTIEPDGSLSTRDIKGSADTAFHSYDWRTYASITKGRSKSSKKRKLSAPVKAKGDADNCSVDFEVQVPSTKVIETYNFDDDILNDAINEAWAKQSINGFPSIDEFHGYDATYHEGVRPDKTKYHLPNYHNGEAFDPVFDTSQMAALMKGEFDPRTHYDPMQDLYGEGYWNPPLTYTKDQSWDDHWS